MRYLIVASLLLSCSLCLAEDFQKNTNEIKSLTAEQAAELVELVGVKRAFLSLNGLTSIDKDVAQELAKFTGAFLALLDLSSLDEVSHAYLKLNKSIELPQKYSD